MSSVPCSHGCSDPALVRVSLPQGCVAFPDARELNLCYHHWRRGDDQGHHEPARVLEVFQAFTLHHRDMPINRVFYGQYYHALHQGYGVAVNQLGNGRVDLTVTYRPGLRR